MKLKKADKLLEKWEYALAKGANVVLMRHGPKSGSNETGLSEQGKELAKKYGIILSKLDNLEDVILVCTEKERTSDTLKFLFPFSAPENYLRFPELNSPMVSLSAQEQINKLHAEIGHWRGYYLNHTYYFLENLGGRFDQEDLMGVASRMTSKIKELFEYNQPVIYCGHSPSIEVVCERLLGISLSELGGFLNPLDSIHLRKNGKEINFVVRVNPIIDYVDLESETYYKTS